MKKYLFLIVSCVFVFSANAFSAVKTWDGGGADANWQTAANWVGDVAPAANDDLVFPAAAAQQATNNNLFFFIAFNSITFEGGAYTVGGNPLTLRDLNANAGTHSINTAVSLGSGAQPFTAGQTAVVTIVILNVGGNPLTLEGAGSFGIGILSGSGAITKNGVGASLIAGSSNYSGALNINDGILVVDANLSNSVVTVNSASTGGMFGLSGLGGTGTVGATTVTNGGISAGTLDSPTGILNVNGNLTFSANGNFVAKIGGTTPGANGHDQLNVTGTVTLNNARLVPLPWNAFRPAINDSFVILRNDGTDPINGTFLNAPEGAIFGGALNTAFRISYTGGDGNDIVITRVNKANFDFDGDGKTDVSVFRPSDGTWYALLSGSGALFGRQFGASGDQPAPADFDADNKTDTAVFRPTDGYWYILRSFDSTFTATQFGANGDYAVPNDFDGDGRADVAVFRPADGGWYQLRSLGNQFFAQQFGNNQDKPAMGDFDGDGIGDLAVFRSDGNWYILRSSDGAFYGLNFGFGTDRICPADYDGDGKTDIAVYRGSNNPSEADFYLLRSSDGGFQALAFGAVGDVPVAADYDGDGKADFAVFRPTENAWYLLRSTAGFTGVVFGLAGDKPVPAAFVP